MKIRCSIAIVLSCLCAVFVTAQIASHPRGLPEKQQPSQSSQGKPHTAPSSPIKKTSSLHVHGTMVAGGAECQRFRASDGKFYTLSGDLHGFHTGDEVEITGTTPEVSHCMQDTTIEVQTIQRVKSSNSGTPQS